MDDEQQVRRETMLRQFEAHLGSGVVATAEALARQLLAEFPDDEEAHVALARVTALGGRVETAVAMLTDLRPAEQGLNHALAYLSSLLMLKGDDAGAAATAWQVVEAGAEEPMAWRVMGLVGTRQGAHEEAIPYLSKVLSVDPSDAECWRALGEAYRATKRHRASAQAYEHVVALNRADVGAWVELLKARVNSADADRARTDLVDAMVRFPRHPEILKVAHQVRVLGTATSDPIAEELSAVRALVDKGDRAAAAARLDSVFKVHRPTRAMKFVRAEVDTMAPGLDVPSAILASMNLVKQYAEAWEPRTLLGDLLLRKSRMQNIRQALTHADEGWTMSGGHPHAGQVLARAYRANGKVGLADAIENQLKMLAPATAPPAAPR